MATGSTLGDLLARAGVAVSAGSEPASAETAGPVATAEPGELDLSRCGKVVVRRERKGRGGKTATVVRGLPVELREAAARALKRGLGCGARVEEDSVVVQGDLVGRVQAWLAERGARRIVPGT